MGNVTMTNLKAATGINDDRLSAHAPSGPGVQAKFGDFLVEALGTFSGAPELTYEAYITRPNSTQLYLEKGDTFEILLQVGKLRYRNSAHSEHWFEQVFKERNDYDLDNPNAALQGITLANEEPSRFDIHLTYKVQSFGSVYVTVRQTGKLNARATNHDTVLEYDSTNDPNTEVRTASPAMDKVDIAGDPANDQQLFTVELYDPNDQINEHVQFNVKSTAPPNAMDDADGEQNASYLHSYQSGREGSTEDIVIKLYDGAPGSGGTLVQSETVGFQYGSDGQTTFTNWA